MKADNRRRVIDLFAERVREDLTDDEVGRARSELERFRDQVETAKPGMIEQDTSFRIISYTEALIAELE